MTITCHGAVTAVQARGSSGMSSAHVTMSHLVPRLILASHQIAAIPARAMAADVIRHFNGSKLSAFSTVR
jgi:hypothetical protein